ncbi:hypothetical protein Dimus_026958 [Dionaea muscipula]
MEATLDAQQIQSDVTDTTAVLDATDVVNVTDVLDAQQLIQTQAHAIVATEVLEELKASPTHASSSHQQSDPPPDGFQKPTCVVWHRLYSTAFDKCVSPMLDYGRVAACRCRLMETISKFWLIGGSCECPEGLLKCCHCRDTLHAALLRDSNEDDHGARTSHVESRHLHDPPSPMTVAASLAAAGRSPDLPSRRLRDQQASAFVGLSFFFLWSAAWGLFGIWVFDLSVF